MSQAVEAAPGRVQAVIPYLDTLWSFDEGRILQSSITGRPILANGEWQGLQAGEHDCSQEEFNAKVGVDAFPDSADKRGW
jgi:hypothetical protein